MPCHVPKASRPADHGDRQRRGGESRLDVGRHVVRTFVDVGEVGIPLRNVAVQPLLQIPPCGGVRVLLDREARRGMLDHHGAEPLGQRRLLDGGLDEPGDLVEALAPSRDLDVADHGSLTVPSGRFRCERFRRHSRARGRNDGESRSPEFRPLPGPTGRTRLPHRRPRPPPTRMESTVARHTGAVPRAPRTWPATASARTSARPSRSTASVEMVRAGPAPVSRWTPTRRPLTNTESTMREVVDDSSRETLTVFGTDRCGALIDRDHATRVVDPHRAGVEEAVAQCPV